MILNPTWKNKNSWWGSKINEDKQMKKIINLLVISLLFASTLSAQSGSFERIEQNFFTSDTNTVMVVCHRAYWRSAPENSIPAIENAIKIGADMVEIDVRKSSDGVFVLMHDATVNRTTNGTGTVAYMTLSQLKSLRLLDLANGGVVTDEQIPTLAEALQVIKGNIMVNLDSKVPIDDIYPLLDSLDIIDHVLIKSGQSPAQAIAFLNSLPGPVLYMPVLADASDTADIQNFIDDVGVNAFEIIFGTESHPLISENSFALYQGGNVRVWVNTLWASLCAGHTDNNALTNPDGNWGWVMDKGFNIIQSDRPVELLEYLRENGRHRYLLDIIPFDDVLYAPGDGTFKVGGLNNGDYIWFDSDTIQTPVNGENDSTYTKYLNENTTMWVSSISDGGNSRVPVSIIIVVTTDEKLGLHSEGGPWQFFPASNYQENLPNVLMIGNSVMNGYYHFVIDSLRGKANVDYWLTPKHLKSEHLFTDLAKVVSYREYDVIQFNIGLHGWPEGRILKEEYKPLLEKYVSTIQENAPSSILIWASTTPVTEEGKPELNKEINPTIASRNIIAVDVMKEMNVGVNDLNGLVKDKLHLATLDRFHWKGEGYTLMGRAVVNRFLLELRKNK